MSRSIVLLVEEGCFAANVHLSEVEPQEAADKLASCLRRLTDDAVRVHREDGELVVQSRGQGPDAEADDWAAVYRVLPYTDATIALALRELADEEPPTKLAAEAGI